MNLKTLGRVFVCVFALASSLSFASTKESATFVPQLLLTEECNLTEEQALAIVNPNISLFSQMAGISSLSFGKVSADVPGCSYGLEFASVAAAQNFFVVFSNGLLLGGFPVLIFAPGLN